MARLNPHARRRNPRARRRRGAVDKVELDGSVTLYGVEDWTELTDRPVYRLVSRTDPGAAAPPPDAGGGEADPGAAEGDGAPEPTP